MTEGVGIEIDLRLEDCLEALVNLDDNSIDSIVTDPPYGLKFMNKHWDYDVPEIPVWKECLRVLKPGGHMLVACGTRTQHRMAVNIEDAGFEIRDVITWLYGSGFPKSLCVSKAIDKAAGAERTEVIKSVVRSAPTHAPESKGRGDIKPAGIPKLEYDVCAPSTPLAKQWQGWGTSLKPAAEFWTLARKPLIGTVAKNVEEYGTGGLNIDGCRVEMAKGESNPSIARYESTPQKGNNGWEHSNRGANFEPSSAALGRFPANLILDEESAKLLDEQSGESNSSRKAKGNYESQSSFGWKGQINCRHHDSGGASRFFYVAKASKSERNAGLDGVELVSLEISLWESAVLKAQLQVDTAQFPPKVIGVSGTQNNSVTEWNTLLFGSKTSESSNALCRFTTKTPTSSTTESKTLSWLARLNTSASIPDANSLEISGGNLADLARRSSLLSNIISDAMASATNARPVQSNARLLIKSDGALSCTHPTVKPVKLMRYLCRLVTPPKGTVLDPFMGSGSTGIAAKLEGFSFTGIERDKDYFEIAKKRIDPVKVGGSNAQHEI